MKSEERVPHRFDNPFERLKMKMELECQECDKVFSRSTKAVAPKCPRCSSEDLYPIGWVRPKTAAAQRNSVKHCFQKRPQRYSDYF